MCHTILKIAKVFVQRKGCATILWNVCATTGDPPGIVRIIGNFAHFFDGGFGEGVSQHLILADIICGQSPISGGKTLISGNVGCLEKFSEAF